MLGGAELAFVELVKCLSKKDEVVVSVPNLDGPLVARLKDIGIQDLIANEYSLWMQQEFTLKRKVKCFFRILGLPLLLP